MAGINGSGSVHEGFDPTTTGSLLAYDFIDGAIVAEITLPASGAAFMAPAAVVVRAPKVAPRLVPWPHLARPIVAPGGPKVIVGQRGKVTLQALQRALVAERSAGTHRLAGPIVAPGRAVVPGRTAALQAIQAAVNARRIKKPQITLPKPVVAPGGPVTVVGNATQISQAQHRAVVIRRPATKSKLAPPIVAPGAPVVAGHTITLQSLQAALNARRGAPKPHLPPRTLAASIAPPLAVGQFVTEQARMRAYLGRTIFKPHLSGPIVAPGGPFVAGRTNTEQQIQTALYVRRGAPRPHLAQPVLVRPPVARGSFNYQVSHIENRRPAPHPHLTGPIVAPGGPFIAGRTDISQALQSAIRARRGAPKPHLAPPNLTPSAVPPVARGTFIFSPRQSEVTVRRGAPEPHVAPIISAPGGAVIPKATIKLQAIAYAKDVRRSLNPEPHLAKPVPATPAPLPPAKIVSQALRAMDRVKIRPVPRPHVARPIIGIRAVVPGATKITQQANQRMRIHRTGPPEPHLARSLVTASTYAIFTIGHHDDHVDLGKLELRHQATDDRWASRFGKSSQPDFSLIKEAGVYTQVGVVDSVRINAAQAFYQGGRSYVVTIGEASALIAAGYGSYVSYP